MKKTSKWPSRAFNLLMVLAMVISLSAILVASPVAAQDLECNPWHVYNGCHLAVAVNTYVKDVDGAFSPKSTFTPGECFYVNAVVVNDGNDTALGPITATISWSGSPNDGIILGTGEGNLTKTWAGNLTGSAQPGANAIADFWWLVCCNSANGGNYITVTATPAQSCDQSWPANTPVATGCTYVTQGTTEVPPCLDIEIVEAPGMAAKVGKMLDDQGHPVVYHSSLPDTISPCTTFGIKAEITNNCNCTITNMQALINVLGQAKVVDGDPSSWPVGTDGSLAPGNTTVVGWMLHCEDVGDGIVNISVNATGTTTCPVAISGPLDAITYGNNTYTVHQTMPGGLVVEITDPAPQYGCDGSPLPIKIPTGCNLNKFLVTAKVSNTGDSDLLSVLVSLAATPGGWVTLPVPGYQIISVLAGHTSQYVYFGNATCTKAGTGNITVTAQSGLVTVSTGINDPVTITQSDIQAEVAPTVLVGGEPDWPIAGRVNPYDVNQCQEFGVAFRYSNSAVPWNLYDGNVTACINWDGASNVEFTGQVWYRRVESGTAAPWVLLPGLSDEAKAGNLTDRSGQNCEQIQGTPTVPTICPCCSVDVLWVFRCKQADTSVVFNSTISVQQTGQYAFTGNDTSNPWCVDQQWKAHLTSSVLFFVQDPMTGVMTNQGAVVPNTYFHVVIPVVNTGEADAQDVQVYFTVSGVPTGSFTYEGYSGDVVSMDHTPGSSVFTAHMGTIYGTDYCGPSAKKIILLLKCNGEGEVDVTVPTAVGGTWASAQGLSVALGVRGTDANSGTWVPQANIVVPNCPEIMYQIPFTVVMENPQTCQTFNQGEVFPVKALITNGGTVGIDGVIATINICGNATMSTAGNATLLTPQPYWTDTYGCGHGNKTVGNITAGRSYEVVWMLVCDGAGDVYINVSATVPSPNISATSDTVIVHQIAIPTACLDVIIMSPDEHQSDNPDNHGHPMIATGQQFAVSAKIINHGPDAAENVVATIYPSGCYFFVKAVDGGSGQGRYVSLAPDETGNRTYDSIAADDFVVATFTLVGGGTSDWGLKDCNVRTADICVNATTDTNTNQTCDATDNVEVSVYPAAFLVATIDSIAPSNSITLGGQFTVNYTVTNYGVADATSVAVTLAADSKVSPALGSGGYTQLLGTVPGWGFGDVNSVASSFQLQCTAAGLSTLTLTPTGQDECGWHPVLGDKSYEEQVWEYGWVTKGDTNIQWVPLWGNPIWTGFLVPASETIAQSPSGGADLSITKTVDNASPIQSAVVHFTVTVTNNGPADATGILVSDSQPSGLTFGAATASQGSFASGVWTVGNLIAGGSASLVIPATVTNAASPITNTASVTAGQFDPNSTNNSAWVTLNGGKLTSVSVTFKHGSWTLFSMPLVPGNTTPEAVLSGLPTNGTAVVYRYDAATSTWSSCTLGVGGTLTAITDGWGYWVYLGGTLDKTFNVTGTELPLVIAGSQPPVPPSYDVFVGWNLLGFKSTTAKAENAYLAGIANLYTKIYGYADGAYFTVMSGANLQPGSGYWIAVPGAVPGTKVGSIFP